MANAVVSETQQTAEQTAKAPAKGSFDIPKFSAANYDPEKADGKVELIAIVRGKINENGEFVPSTDDKGRERVNFQVNNSQLTKAQIAKGEGEVNPSLRRIYTGELDANGKPKAFSTTSMTASQMETIRKAGEGKAIVIADKQNNGEAIQYVPFQSTVMSKTIAEGDFAKAQYRMPNVKTVVPSAYPALTEARVGKHFSNTHAIAVQHSQAAAKAKEAKMAEMAASEVTAQTNEPNVEADYAE